MNEKEFFVCVIKSGRKNTAAGYRVLADGPSSAEHIALDHAADRLGDVDMVAVCATESVLPDRYRKLFPLIRSNLGHGTMTVVVQE